MQRIALLKEDQDTFAPASRGLENLNEPQTYRNNTRSHFFLLGRPNLLGVYLPAAAAAFFFCISTVHGGTMPFWRA